VKPAILLLQPPPSANNLWKQQGARRVRTFEYASWTTHVVTATRLQKFPKNIATRCVIIVGVTRSNARADIDNRIKPLLDALKSAGVYKDDNMVTAVAAAWQPDSAPLMQVMMLPATQRITLEYIPLTPDGFTGGWFLTALNGEDYGNRFGVTEESEGRDGAAKAVDLR